MVVTRCPQQTQTSWRLSAAPVGLTLRGEHLSPPSGAPATVFMCQWADFIYPTAGVCVWCSYNSSAADLPKCPSIHPPPPLSLTQTDARRHHTLDGGAHHNVTFNSAEPAACSLVLMDWMMVKKKSFQNKRSDGIVPLLRCFLIFDCILDSNFDYFSSNPESVRSDL